MLDLAAIFESVERFPGSPELPSGAIMAIANRLESALVSPQTSSIKDLAEQLHKLFSALLSKAAPEVREAVRGAKGSQAATRQAFALGQTSFAQALAAQVAARRESDEFLEMLKDSRYVRYLQTLARNDSTNRDLAVSVGEREETVSRKLRELRDVGLTDFRREGREVLNFLTPAAREAMADAVQRDSDDDSTPLGSVVAQEAKRCIVEDLKPHLRTAMTFSPIHELRRAA